MEVQDRLSRLRPKLDSRWQKNLYILVALTCTFLLIHLLLNGRLWIWDLFSIVPPWLLFLVWILSLIALVLLGDRRVVILVALMGIWYIPKSSISLTASSSDASAEYKLVNWNTEYWDDDQSWIEDFASAGRPDIIHLQEALNLEGGVIRGMEVDEDFLSEEGYQVFQGGELVTATTFPVTNVSYVESGKFLRVDTEVTPEQVVSFYNVHIPVHLDPVKVSKPIDFLEDMKRRSEWRNQVINVLRADLENNSNPVVISGDFNAHVGMPIVSYFFQNFTNAYSQTNIGVPTTYQFAGLKMWEIDYVFGSEKINFTSYSQRDPQGHSDHFGIETGFSIN